MQVKITLNPEAKWHFPPEVPDHDCTVWCVNDDRTSNITDYNYTVKYGLNTHRRYDGTYSSKDAMTWEYAHVLAWTCDDVYKAEVIE